VQAREEPSQAIGARFGSFNSGPKPMSDVGGNLLSGVPTGLLWKLLVVIGLMIVFYFVVQRSTSSLRSAAGVTNGASKNTGNIVERFKKGNPVFQQDEENRKADGS
jgi:hypothetical protein